MKISFFMIGLFALALLFIGSGGFYIVNQNEQVIITQFGKTIGPPVTEPGLHFKIPFIQTVNRLDKRFLEWDGAPVGIPTKDKTYIYVDAFGRWRIADPLPYFLRIRDERSAQSRLEDILGSEIRNSIAKHELIEIVRSDKSRKPLTDETLTSAATEDSTLGTLRQISFGRQKIEQEIKEAAAGKLREFGIELLDLRLKRVNYNPEVLDRIYQRMISERLQIAQRFRSEEIYLEMARLQHEMENERRISNVTDNPNDSLETLARFYSHSDVIQGRNRLKFQPMRKNNLTQSNLQFRKDNLRLNTIDEADIIRLGTVLVPEYYTDEEANQALQSLTPKLREGGIVIIASGDDHSLVFEKQGDALLPKRCTLMLRNGYGNYDPDIIFPGTTGLKEAVAEALQSVSERSIFVGNPMSTMAAEQIKRSLETMGYKASYIMQNGTWMEIDLSDRV